MKCPNCQNELEFGGSKATISMNTASKRHQDGQDNVLCTYCSAELTLVLKKVWLNRIGTYIVVIPAVSIFFYPELIGEKRWLLLFLIALSFSTKLIADKIPTYKIRSGSDGRQVDGTDRVSKPDGSVNPYGTTPAQRRLIGYDRMASYAMMVIFFTAIFSVGIAKERFEYASVLDWVIALATGTLASGYVIAIRRLLEFAETRYAESLLTRYRTFAKRPMNASTISIIALLMIPIAAALFSVMYCFIQIIKIGLFFLTFDAA